MLSAGTIKIRKSHERTTWIFVGQYFGGNKNLLCHYVVLSGLSVWDGRRTVDHTVVEWLTSSTTNGHTYPLLLEESYFYTVVIRI